MKFVVDSDLHIHSRISPCSNDEKQDKYRILQYAKDFGLKTICITDHFWDEFVPGAKDGYEQVPYSVISSVKPLPQEDGIEFLFGCETELDKDMRLAISKERMGEFDFIIIPTVHLHFKGLTIREEDDSPEIRAKLWVERFEAVLDMDLPFYKVGIAHLTDGLMAPGSREKLLKTLNLIKTEDMERIFKKAAEKGCGIELNGCCFKYSDDERETILRPYIIAKKCGCKFYCGSDAHTGESLNNSVIYMKRAVEELELTEDNKFRIIKK